MNILRVDLKMIRRDMFGDIELEDCPPEFRREAINILRVISDNPFWGYTRMNELDKKLTLLYWQHIDGLDISDFRNWYVKLATVPDAISRARRWLIDPLHGYLIVKPEVLQRAKDAERRWC